MFRLAAEQRTLEMCCELVTEVVLLSVFAYTDIHCITVATHLAIVLLSIFFPLTVKKGFKIDQYFTKL